MAENDGKPDDQDGKPEGGKTFTQAELDEIIGKRLARQKADFADYDDLKAAKAELDKLKADNASELDKAKAEAKAEGISEATTNANRRIIAAAARALAADARFHEPKDAPLLLDLSKVKVNDDGEADEDAIKALIDAEVEKRPYLVKSKDEPKKLKRDPGQGNHGNGKPDGRESGRAEALRRYPQLAKK